MLVDTEERYWKIGRFAQKIGKHQNTIDNWFKKLEEERIHFVNRVGNEKVYDELDYQVAQFIKQRRERGWALQAIFDELPHRIPVRDTPTTEEVKEEFERINQLEKKVQEYMETITNAIEQQQRRQQQMLEEEIRALREKERFERLNMRLTEITLEKKLKEEAEKKWDGLDDSEKYIKKGVLRTLFFGKEVDLEKKQKFIETYIQENIVEKLKEEFEVYDNGQLKLPSNEKSLPDKLD